MKPPPQYVTARSGRSLVDREPEQAYETYRAQAQAIPSLDDIDSATLPDVPDRYAAKEPARPVAKFVDDNTVEVAELDQLTLMALDKAKEILSLPLDSGDEDFTSILRAQASQVQTIFTAQLRADEGRFRKKQADNLGKLLTILAVEEKKLLVGKLN